MTTRQVQIGCSFRYSSTMPVAAVFQVQARDTARVQISDEQLTWSGAEMVGSGPLHCYVDEQDNRRIRLTIPAGTSELVYTAIATVPDEVDAQAPEGVEGLPESLPDEVMAFLLPSRFCQSDLLSDQAWRRFGQTPPGVQRVQAISTFVHEHLIYTTGSTGPTTTALDVYTSGRGVCRDFAHLMIAMCRAMNIPARYAFGYFPDMDFTPTYPSPMDFHAWVQVWLGDAWYDFDPRHDFFRKGRILVGTGRDAADTALVTTFGGPRMLRMEVTALEVGAEPQRP